MKSPTSSLDIGASFATRLLLRQGCDNHTSPIGVLHDPEGDACFVLPHLHVGVLDDGPARERGSFPGVPVVVIPFTFACPMRLRCIEGGGEGNSTGSGADFQHRNRFAFGAGNTAREPEKGHWDKPSHVLLLVVRGTWSYSIIP